MFGGYVQETAANGGFPPAPPSPVRVGRTLFVSERGNDAIAAREDLAYHYLTLDEALLQAQPGDLIVLYPGAYNCTHDNGLSVVDRLTIFAHPGVTISGFGLFRGFRDGFQLTGFADVASLSWTDLANDVGVASTTMIECNSLALENTDNLFGGGLKIQCHDKIVFGGSELYIFNFLADVTAAVYDVYIRAPKIEMGLGTPAFGFAYGIVIQGLPQGSRIIFDVPIIENLDNRMAFLLYVQGPMIYNVTINGTIIDQTTYIAPGVEVHGVGAYENAAWNTVGPSENSGFFINGQVIMKTKGCLKLVGGKIEMNGNVVSDYISTPACSLFNSSVDDTPSILHLYSGYGKTEHDTLVYYDQGGGASGVGNRVRFKDYIGVAQSFLVDSVIAAETYQLLSAYSNKAVNAAKVSNSIAGTTLIVDAAITI
jgi:hypothetical protein